MIEPGASRAKVCMMVVLLAAAVSVTAGCNPFRDKASKANELCKEPEALKTTPDNPALKIPAGLESPDTRNALRIPPLNTPVPPTRTKGQGCLDEPPSFVIAKPKEPQA